MANLNLSEFTEKTLVADADWVFVWDTAGLISKKVSRNSLLSGTTADFHLGLADAAAPIAQTLSVQSVVAGTTNTAGQAFTIDGSQGTGTGAGGPLVFRTAPAGSSGSTVNALGTALTLTAAGYVVPKSWLLQNGFAAGLEMYGSDADALSRNVNSSRRAVFNGTYLAVNSGFSIGWSLNNGSGNDGGNFGQADTILVRDGVGTLALRNGAAAQTFRVYNTYTDASNYERLNIQWSGNVARIFPSAAGSGSVQSIYFGSDAVANNAFLVNSASNSLQLNSNGAERVRITSAGNVGIGTTAPSSKLQVTGGDVEIETVTSGIIMKAAGTSTRYRITLNAGGTALVFTAV